MNTVNLARSILLINTAICLTFAMTDQLVYSSEISSSNNYQIAQNVNSLADNQSRYTKSISDYEQILKLNPQDVQARNNLASAYISRGTYLYDSGINPAKAANDFRKAIFYLKFDEKLTDNIALDSISIAYSGLTKALNQQKISNAPKARFKIAKELRGQGNFQESIVEFNEALADPDIRIEAFEALGDIMRVLQKDNAAIDYYANALSINSNVPNLHLKIARALNKVGNSDAAIKEYNLALNSGGDNTEIISALESLWKSRLQQNPQDADAHMNLGVILQKKKDYQGALAEYKASETINPSNQTLRLNLGTLFQAQGDIPTAISAYDSILQVNPTNTLAHYYRATALKESGRIQEAIDELQIVLKIEPSNTLAKTTMFELIKKSPNPDMVIPALENFAVNNPNDALAQYNLAFELHSKKRTDEALNYYQKAIMIDPKLVDAYLNIASIYREKSQYTEAITTLQNALTVNPNNQKAKNMLDQIQDSSTLSKYQQAIKKHNSGDYDGAIQDYLELIKATKPSSDIYVSLGAAYQAQNKTSDAINSYNKAISMDSTNSSAYYYLGTVYYSNRNYNKALESYKKALTYDPKNTEIQEAIKAVNLANADNLLEAGLNEYNAKKYQKALDIFNSVLKSNPDNAYAYYYRAMVYDDLNKLYLAIADYKKALEKSNELTDAYYALAIDYDTLKNTIEAKKAYQKYISLSKDQNSEYVKYAKVRIKQIK